MALKSKKAILAPTHEEGRLIDHCYVPLDLKDIFDTQIMFKYYTDHAGIQIKF